MRTVMVHLGDVRRATRRPVDTSGDTPVREKKVQVGSVSRLSLRPSVSRLFDALELVFLVNYQNHSILTDLPPREQIEGDRHADRVMISFLDAADRKQGGARTATTTRCGAASQRPVNP